MKKLLITIMIVAAFLIAACSAPVENIPQEQPVEEPTEEVEVNEVQETELQAREESEVEQTQEQIDQLIADGTYVKETSYQAPPGREHIVITLEVKDDIVQFVSVEGTDNHPTSSNFITGVNNAVQTLLVGKPISEVDNLPDQISRSSLTAGEFKRTMRSLIERY